MERTFIEIGKFLSQWNALGLNDDDLFDLQSYLLLNPEAGSMIQATGGVRKLRWLIPGKGRRSGARIIYIDFINFKKIYLLTTYKKNEKIDLTPDEKK